MRGAGKLYKKSSFNLHSVPQFFIPHKLLIHRHTGNLCRSLSFNFGRKQTYSFEFFSMTGSLTNYHIYISCVPIERPHPLKDTVYAACNGCIFHISGKLEPSVFKWEGLVSGGCPAVWQLFPPRNKVVPTLPSNLSSCSSHNWLMLDAGKSSKLWCRRWGSLRPFCGI